MREIRQSGSEGGGNEQTVSPYPYPFTITLFKNKRPMEHSPWAFTFTLFLPPTPNPLPDAFKPTHCAGWVCLLQLHYSKTSDPWNTVHGL